MRITEWGEDTMIDFLKERFKPPKGVVGIGDDCAVIPNHNSLVWLMTTDLMVEDVHFLKNRISAEELGWKAAIVNISDIAAMGGAPLYAFLSGGLPKTTEKSWVKNFLKGFETACQKYGVTLLGGDTTSAAKITINAMVIGSAEAEKVKYRNTAKPGDAIFVTGELGNAGGGLKALLENKDEEGLIKSHHCPVAHVKEGQWLASHPAVHAMMDVSDGVAQDLGRMAKASRCGAEVFAEDIPLSKILKKACKKYGWDPYSLALSGGEDYCLLLTIDPKAAVKLQKGFEKEFGRPLHKIGKITAEKQVILTAQGEILPFVMKGFSHF